MDKMSTYTQLKDDPQNCLKALRAETSLKFNSVPFAIKVNTALKAFSKKNSKMTEQRAIDVAFSLISSIQTLYAGGITDEDFDKVDIVPRGFSLQASARVEAFYRAAARKGYQITDTIIPVPKDDEFTTYFAEKENSPSIAYFLVDSRNNPDRKYNAERIAKGYFSKYILRLDIFDLKRNHHMPQIIVEMPNEEMIKIANSSESGVFKAYWEKYTNNFNQERSRKVITNKVNDDEEAPWVKWTKDMCEKSIVRKALKRVKEVLPDLKEAIYAFEQDEEQAPQEPQAEKPMINIPMQEVKVREDVNLKALTDEQKRDCQDLLEIYRANPKLMADKVQEIADIMESGERPIQDVINEYYADIKVFKRFKKPKEMVNNYFGGML